MVSLKEGLNRSCSTIVVRISVKIQELDELVVQAASRKLHKPSTFARKMPNAAQFLALFQDLVFLTNGYISIHLVRVDERSGNLIILAGEEIEIEINTNGRRTIR